MPRKKKPVQTCDLCTKPYTLMIADLRQKRILYFCPDHKPAPKTGEF